MRKCHIVVFTFLVFAFVEGLIFSSAALPFSTGSVDAQAVTLTPLSLTPVTAPPQQPVPITANTVDRLTLFATIDTGPSLTGPMWTPSGRLVVLNIKRLNTLFPPGDTPLRLELTPDEEEDQTWRIEKLALSSDGRLIAGGGNFFPDGVLTGFVQVWDSATGKMLDLVDDLEGGLLSLALSPDGKYLAAGGGSGIRLWQVTQDGKLLPGPTVSDQYPNIFYLVFSPDSQQLAAVTFVGIVVYSFSSGQAVPPLQGTIQSPGALAFSPDGSLLAALAEESESDRLVVWDLRTGQQIDLSVPHEGVYSRGDLRGLGFSPDGSLLAAAHGNKVRLWDVSSHQNAAFLEMVVPDVSSDIRVSWLAFSPDGTLLAIADTWGRDLWLWGVQ